MKNDKTKMRWWKNPHIEDLMIFFTIAGVVLFIVLLYFSTGGNIRKVLLGLTTAYPIALLVIYLALRSNRFIPREYSLSDEGLHIRYRTEVKSYLWKDISNIEIRKVRLDKVLAVELVDGRVDLISSLTERSRKRIMDYYRKQRSRESHRKQDGTSTGMSPLLNGCFL